jgi:beta-lactam-binding protein with PASTA domain
MAKTGPYDPRNLVDDQVALTRTADAASASAFKHQTFLHRQRAGAAKVRLNRALQQGAPKEEIAALQAQLITREARLAQVEAQFAAADIVSPAPDSDLAQVLGLVTGDVGEPPHTAALISTDGEVLAETKIQRTGGFVLSVAGRISGVRLQVSDANQVILFRDAEGFDVAPGQVLTRTVSLEAPCPKPTPAPTTLTTPNVVGQTEEAACAILFRLGVRDIRTVRQPDPGPAGIVLSQDPAAGTVLVPDEGATLMVSEKEDQPGPEPVLMPDFIGRPIDEVRAEAKDLKIRLAEVTRADDAPKGEVISQSPAAGSELSPPRQATVVVSAGATEGVEVPDVVGQPEDEASDKLNGLGFTVARRTVNRPGEPGLVVDQQPKGGTVLTQPARVVIVVNLGQQERPSEVVVPRLTDRTLDEATSIAREAGLTLSRTNVSRDGPQNAVLEQSPQAGSRVTLPATIRIVVNTRAVSVQPRDDPAFQPRLTAAILADSRTGSIGLNQSDVTAMVQRLELRTEADVARVIALDNAELMARAGTRNRSQARTLRSVLRSAIQGMG